MGNVFSTEQWQNFLFRSKNLPRTVEKKKKLKMIIQDSGAFFAGLEFIVGNMKMFFFNFFFRFVFYRESSGDGSITCLILKICYRMQKTIRLVVFRFSVIFRGLEIKLGTIKMLSSFSSHGYFLQRRT